MKRKVAILLAFVMLITTFQGVTFAASNDAAIGFVVDTMDKAGTLKEDDSTGIRYVEATNFKNENIEASKESALAQWNINGDGKYTLECHLLTINNVVVTMKLEYTVAGDNVTVKCNPDPSSVTYINKKLTGNGWKTETGSQITQDLINNGIQSNFKVSGITVNNKAEGDDRYLDIKTLVKNQKVYVLMNGIIPGNIIDYTLKKDNVVVGSDSVFSTPANLKVEPTHFVVSPDGTVTNNTSPTKYGIDQGGSIITEKLPGSVPGNKVSFSIPKRYNTSSGTFQMVDISGSSQPDSVELILRGPQKNTETGGSVSRELRLEFETTTGSSIRINSTTPTGTHIPKIQRVGDTISVAISGSLEDLTKDLSQAAKNKVKEQVIDWSELDSSMLINYLSFEYRFAGSQTNALTASMHGVAGYTYLEFLSLKKTGPNKVRVTFKPFYTDQSIDYQIMTGSSLSTLTSVDNIENIVGAKTDELVTDITVSDAGDVYMRIDALIDGKPYPSQIIIFNPALHTLVPNIPIIEDVDNIFVVSEDVDTNYSEYHGTGREKITLEAIGMDLKINPQMTYSEVIKALKDGKKIYYELYVNSEEINLSNSSNPYVSKLLELKLDASGTKVKVVAGGTIEEEPYLNPKTGCIEIQNLYLKNLTELGWEKLNVDDVEPFTGHYTIDNSSLTNFKIPNTYYLAARCIVVDQGNNTLKGEVSVSKNISLDNTVVSIPVPSIKSGESDVAADYSKISENIKFGLVDIKEYVDTMLTPATIYLGNSLSDKANAYHGNIEFFVSQDKEKLTNEKIMTQYNGVNGASKVRKITTSAAIEVALSSDEVKALRNNNVVAFSLDYGNLNKENQTDHLKLVGLDDNTTYYVTARVRLEPESSIIKNIAYRYSKVASLYSFTTITKPSNPDAEDKTPVAPEKIWVVEDEENTDANTVKIAWEPVKMKLEDGERIYYELVRTDTKEFDQGKSVKVEDIVGTNKAFIGFRNGSFESPFTLMQIYKDGIWNDLTNQLASTYKVTDDSLQPNKVYYYYVRTVLVVDGEESRSKWIMTPYTTAPIKAPKNLKIESSKEYSINPKTEVVVSFDAPVANPSDVPSSYDFEFAIKSEDDSEYTEKYSKVTKESATTDYQGLDEGYSHFVYKITDLEPNRRYNIKVRIIDKTQKLEDGSHPTSLYTDIVSFKTDYDEDKDKADEAYEDYLKIFNQAIEKLKTRSYWVVDDDVYKYKKNYLITEISGQREYNLVVDKEAKSATYYFPASIIDAVNEENTIFNIKFNNQTISIRPRTLTENNPAIKEAYEKLNQDHIEDYYLKVTVRLGNGNEEINGQKALSPSIDVDMEIAYLKENDEDIEAIISENLADIVEKRKSQIIEKLKKELKDNKVDKDELQDIVDSMVSKIEEELKKNIDKLIGKKVKKEESVTSLDKAILIATITDSYAVDGYYYSSGWINVETFQAGGGFAIEAAMLGKYIFVGQANLIDTVPTLAPYQSFIAKYSLTDFFTLDPYMIHTAATNEQIYGALARIMGATRGTDYYAYLESQGIKGLTKLKMQQTARQDQTIYVVMQGYEKMRNRKVASINIKNRQGVQNIGAFQPVYRDYVYAAVELKIVNNPNSQVIPSKQMSVQEVIEILYKMQSK